jgi:hypothetical protein
MRLKLSVGGHIIASIELDEAKAGNLEYIYDQRNILAEACSIFMTETDTPEYFIEVPSRMNLC